MNRHQIDEQLRQRHRKVWYEATARRSPAREAGPRAMAPSGVREGGAFRGSKMPGKPSADGTGLPRYCLWLLVWRAFDQSRLSRRTK